MVPCSKYSPVEWLIIDGAYLVWRSYCSTPKFLSPTGEPTGALHGFIASTRKAIKETGAKHCIVAWEGGSPQREELLPSYKSKRRELPDELSQSFKLVQEVIPLLGWPIIQKAGLEADDVIFSLSKSLPGTKVVFTTDKDIISLVSDDLLIYTREKGKSWLLGETHYKEKWGVEPRYIPDILALSGDAIDEVPGIAGIGKKTATTLVQNFGSIEDILKEAASPTSKIKEKTRNLLLQNTKLLDLNRALIALRQTELTQLSPSTFEPNPAVIARLTSLGMKKTAEQIAKQFQ